MAFSVAAQTSVFGRTAPLRVARKAAAAGRASVSVVAAAERPMWFPNAVAPSYLDGSMAGDRGFDPMGLGADPVAMKWYRQAELQHARWAMLGAAGVLAQSVFVPNVFWYEAALHLPAGLGPVNLGSTLAVQFLLMHWVEVRRWQDMKVPGSVNQDPIFPNNKLPAGAAVGYPGGIFDPLNFAKGNLMELQTKEIKNGRLAMLAFMGFVISSQATGKGPLDNLSAHLSDPAHNNWFSNIGTCAIPSSVDVGGIELGLFCLWPGQHL